MKSWVQFKRKRKGGDSKQDNKSEASKAEDEAKNLRATERR